MKATEPPLCVRNEDGASSCLRCKQNFTDQAETFITGSQECWHEGCMRCSLCNDSLSRRCYLREGQLYCTSDYERLYGGRCLGCNVAIQPEELVMKVLGTNYYHVDCFKCHECGDRLEKGDEFIFRNSHLYCSADFNVADQKSDVDVFSSDETGSISATSPPAFDKSGTAQGCKRPRTILTSQQRQDFKAAFELTPKPCRKVREQLSNETGLSVRVVQVWFQNQRAKLKKLQRKSDSDDVIKKTATVPPGKVTKRKKSKSVSSSITASLSPDINNNNNSIDDKTNVTSTSIDITTASNNVRITSFPTLLDDGDEFSGIYTSNNNVATTIQTTYPLNSQSVVSTPFTNNIITLSNNNNSISNNNCSTTSVNNLFNNNNNFFHNISNNNFLSFQPSFSNSKDLNNNNGRCSGLNSLATQNNSNHVIPNQYHVMSHLINSYL